MRQGARVFGCVAGFWALFGGFSLMVVGSWNYILGGLLRRYAIGFLFIINTLPSSIFGVVSLILEGSIFCICFKGTNWYDNAQDRLDNTNFFYRALVYIM